MLSEKEADIMTRRILLIFILFAVLAAPLAAAERVVILSWDGAADWIVDRLLDEGKLPNVARLAARGVRAEYMTTSFPSLTAPGHASIWTGAWLNRNGITGNYVPKTPFSEHYITDTISGFDAGALTAEPIWLTAVRSGKRAAVLQATQTEPTDYVQEKLDKDKIPRDKLFVSTGFTFSISPPKVFTEIGNDKVSAPAQLQIKIGDTTFNGVIFDDNTNPVKGYDTVRIDQPGTLSQSFLTPGWSTPGTVDRFSQPFKVTKDGKTGYVRFRLFELSPDGKRFLLYHTSVNALDSNQPDQAAKMLQSAGGFLDGEFGVYESGKLGKPIPLGGDGTAERRLLELVRLDIEKLKASTAWGMANLKWDLLINYSPVIDSAEHCWLGVLDPRSPRYNPVIAKKLWPFLEQVYMLNDEWLGDVMERAPEDADIILLSDHGMEGVSKWFYTNRLLEQAGLTVVKPDGRVDPAASKAAAIGDGASIYINTTEHKGGTVTPGQKETLLARIRSLLVSFEDPETGKKVVNRVFGAGEVPEVGTGGPKGADLMIDFADGCTGKASGGKPGVMLDDIGPVGLGMHGGYPYEPRLRAILFSAGPGIARGRLIPPVRTIDIAPTVSKLLGIRPPAQAVGSPVKNLFDTGAPVK